MLTPPPPPAAALPQHTEEQTRRITSAQLLEGRRELEIEHGGKIYRLRLTQLNKLILTA